METIQMWSLEKEILSSIAELVKYDCRNEEDVIRYAWDTDGIIVRYAPITRKSYRESI